MVKSKMNNIMLSVLCTTYGHEKYIRQALDSILMQRVFFSMEVLIGEDCSPDNSRLILKEYEKKYPGFFTVFYRKKNLGAANNYIDLAKRARGKYIAFLELDVITGQIAISYRNRLIIWSLITMFLQFLPKQ